MTAPKKYVHAAEAAARRETLTQSLIDLDHAAEQLESARDAASEMNSRLGSGGVDPDELPRVRARLEIAEAKHRRAEHQVRLDQGRLLNESVDVADRLANAVRALVPGISTVVVVPYEAEQPAGALPVAVIAQTRESVKHPSGYSYTHTNGFRGPRGVSITLWTTTGLHMVPSAEQVARVAQAAQVSTGSRSDPVSVSTTVNGTTTKTVYSLKIFSAWDDVPTVDLASPWYDERQEMSVPVRTALEAPGLPTSISHSSCHSKIISSTVTDGLRSTRVELTLTGATSAWSPDTTRIVLTRLLEKQTNRGHAWLGRCTSAEVVSSKLVDAQGQLLSAQLGGEPAGAAVSGVLEFTNKLPTR